MIKLVTVVAILSALAGLVVFSYVISHDSVQRIACVHNQRLMYEALGSFEMENAGHVPRRVFGLLHYYQDPPERFARCPADPDDAYSYDPLSGVVTCPNPAHRAGL